MRDAPCRSPPTSSSTSSATRRRARGCSDADPGLGRASSGSAAPTGIDLPVGGGGPDPDTGVAQRALRRRGRLYRPPVVGRRQHQPRRSARATCRRRRCRWRSPTRRSPTAAASSRPHLAQRPRTRPAASIQEINPAPRRELEIDPETAQRDHGRAAGGGDGAGRNLLPGLRRLPGRGRRQDRHGGDASQERPVLVRRAGAGRRPRGRRRGDDRGRRLRRRHRARPARPARSSRPTSTSGPSQDRASVRRCDGGRTNEPPTARPAAPGPRTLRRAARRVARARGLRRPRPAARCRRRSG